MSARAALQQQVMKKLCSTFDHYWELKLGFDSDLKHSMWFWMENIVVNEFQSGLMLC